MDKEKKQDDLKGEAERGADVSLKRLLGPAKEGETKSKGREQYIRESSWMY